MLASAPPRLPAFGATSLKMRYDPPISILDRDTGTLSFMDYDDGWPAELADVVVSLPQGGRFVFWRGASARAPIANGSYGQHSPHH
ncbi:MAG: hypothetical protein HYV26_07105 [Candidatus Hydrogenedentes bacterium]|nr:hypothetical protein [Candidatus Hydrogenedentota bacterium]